MEMVAGGKRTHTPPTKPECLEESEKSDRHGKIEKLLVQ